LETNYLKFWGVRGSRSTAESNKLKYGGDTSCVEIRTKNNDLIILDMGTGLNKLGEAILADPTSPKNINIFLSHYHWDHLLGFLNFTPLFDESFSITIYGNNKSTSIDKISEKLLDKAFWPVSLDMLKAKINFVELVNKPVTINNITIDFNEHSHPNGATSYKVTINDFSIMYSTDSEHPNNELNENVLEMAKNTDILIHDSHFTEEDLKDHVGWGHSSWKQAVDVAIKSDAKKLFLFHYSPEYNDDIIDSIEKKAQNILKTCKASRQNLKIKF